MKQKDFKEKEDKKRGIRKKKVLTDEDKKRMRHARRERQTKKAFKKRIIYAPTPAKKMNEDVVNIKDPLEESYTKVVAEAPVMHDPVVSGENLPVGTSLLEISIKPTQIDQFFQLHDTSFMDMIEKNDVETSTAHRFASSDKLPPTRPIFDRISGQRMKEVLEHPSTIQSPFSTSRTVIKELGKLGNMIEQQEREQYVREFDARPAGVTPQADFAYGTQVPSISQPAFLTTIRGLSTGTYEVNPTVPY
mgnify:CR=1 FL=1